MREYIRDRTYANELIAKLALAMFDLDPDKMSEEDINVFDAIMKHPVIVKMQETANRVKEVNKS